MNIRREDLKAAAAAGVVQYRQIDGILIFLLQREVQAQRSRQPGPPAEGGGARRMLYGLFGLLALAAAALGGWYGRVALAALGGNALLGLSAAYLLFTLAMALWLESRGARIGLRLLAFLALMLLPLALLASQRLGGG